jgi:hypothetical protein
MRRQAPIKRSSTGQRTIAGSKAADVANLDDRPLAIHITRDGKHLLVPLPYEVWILGVSSFEVVRTIECPNPEPSVCEGARDGQLWIGGHHLYFGSVFATALTKVGSKLGDFVDRVASLRPGVLCGVGSAGEVLWDIDKEAPLHRRKVSERGITGLVNLDGRALWADGSSTAWLIDPDRPSGYTQLKLRATSPGDVDVEGIAALGTTTTGRAILCARDGGVAWTGRHLRVDGERFPRLAPRQAAPLACGGDERHVYVLRPKGLLQRFLIEQPKPPAGEEDSFVPLPEAEETRLQWPATCMLVLGTGHGPQRIILGGPQADGMLGRLWRVDPDALTWQKITPGKRTLVEPKPPEPEGSKRPDFTPTRSKLSGPPLAALKVDAVLSADPAQVFVTHGHGALLERPVVRRPPGDVLPGDALLLPAMVRFREGTARPALVLWPGTPDATREPPALRWLAWADNPRGWISLETPEIRKQGWSRADVFPLQVALAAAPAVAGNREPIPDKWVDPELFSALARECKKLLKVLWE